MSEDDNKSIHSSLYLITTTTITNRSDEDFEGFVTESNVNETNLNIIEGDIEDDDDDETIEEIPYRIERIEYYQAYNKLMDEFTKEKLNNNYLEMKMVEYYQKRHMFYVLQQQEQPDDQEEQQKTDIQQRYYDKLDKLGMLQDLYKHKQLEMIGAIDELNNEFNSKQQQYDWIYNNYEKSLNEIGINLLTKPKLDRLLRQQRLQLNNLTDIRLKLIKLQNKIKERENEIKNFMKYERFQQNNNNLLEELQYIDADLIKYRQQCNDAIQQLAHKREKDAILNDDLNKYRDNFVNIKEKYQNVRQQLSVSQKQRRFIYKNIEKTTTNSNLLFLLLNYDQDMISSV